MEGRSYMVTVLHHVEQVASADVHELDAELQKCL